MPAESVGQPTDPVVRFLTAYVSRQGARESFV